MREPNFSESQLQQAVNTAFVRRTFELNGTWTFAHVPSLLAEFDLGWDSAFHLPWLPHVPATAHEGCNFFLQFKLSGELTSRGAREWQHWGQEYFRFKIPHSTRNPAGAFVDDYHQWERLKELADAGYPTYYATNSTLWLSALRTWYENGTLLGRVPLLDVRTVSGVHKHVTFAQGAGIFALHSEKEESEKLTLATALERALQERQMSLSTSVNELLAVLRKIGDNESSWQRELERIASPPDGLLPATFQTFIQYAMLASFLRRHVGCHLWWVPKHG